MCNNDYSFFNEGLEVRYRNDYAKFILYKNISHIVWSGECVLIVLNQEIDIECRFNDITTDGKFYTELRDYLNILNVEIREID